MEHKKFEYYLHIWLKVLVPSLAITLAIFGFYFILLVAINNETPIVETKSPEITNKMYKDLTQQEPTLTSCRYYWETEDHRVYKCSLVGTVRYDFICDARPFSDTVKCELL